MASYTREMLPFVPIRIVLFLVVALGFMGKPAYAAEEVVVYEGGLKNTWQDWGWAHRVLTAGQPAHLDMSRYAGWILGNRKKVPSLGAIRFRMRAPQDFGTFLEVRLGKDGDDTFSRVVIDASHIKPQSSGWLEVSVPASELNINNKPYDRIVFRAKKGVGSGYVEIDNVRIEVGEAHTQVVEAAAVSKVSSKLVIDCRAPKKRISPLIYGIAFVPRHASSDDFQYETGATIRRWGGNPASRYNWKLGNAWNTASDWFFKNVNYTKDDAYSWRDFLTETRAHQMGAAMTVPMMGWVAKDTSSVSFPVSVYGPQQHAEGDAGNGMRPGGGKVAGADPKRTSIELTPQFVEEWVAAIEKAEPDPKTPTVRQYILDNEPALWNSTHRDVHPQAVTYDELVERSVTYAAAIRRAAPKASIAGPAEWGWPAYFYSAKDQEVGFKAKPDRRAHGDVPLLAYYLRQMRQHERKEGTRLLDVLDVHYYPQSSGLYGHGEQTDPQGAALRLRATRSLWDKTYHDESWINENIMLLPRLHDLIDSNYPGTKISIGEYNFGGEKHISGALALADALGRFGQNEVHSAYMWTYPPKDSLSLGAFRAYRNYDGLGAAFPEESLMVKDDGKRAIFAAMTPGGERMVAIILNKETAEEAQADIELRGCEGLAASRAFSLSPAQPTLAATKKGETANSGHTSQALAPSSITVVEWTRPHA